MDDYADGLTATPEEERWSILQAFNDRNGLLALDAQDSYPNRDGVTVYQERTAGPYEVISFEDVLDFKVWADALSSLDDEDAEDTIVEAEWATQANRERMAARAYAAGNALGGYVILNPASAYEYSSPKRVEFEEDFAA